MSENRFNPMHRFRRFVIAAVIFLPLLPAAHAQQQRTLTLSDCLGYAFEHSYTARSSTERLRSSKASAEAARRALYSTVDLSFDLPSYSRYLAEHFNPATGLNQYYPVEDMEVTGRLSINQPLIWTNSTFSLSGLLYRRDQSDKSSATPFFRNYYTDLALQLRQPLFVPNTQRISLRRAELAFEEARMDFVRNILDLQYSVTESFYQLYASQQEVLIQTDRVRQQQESYQTAQRKYNSGIIAEVDALQFEVDLSAASNDLLSAENRLLSNAGGFKNLLGLSLKDSVNLVLADTNLIRIDIDIDKAVALAKKTRTELQRAKNDIERSNLDLDEVRANRTVRGDLFLSYGLNNSTVQKDQLYRDMQDSRRAVLTVTVPVFDWGRHAQQVEAAEAQLQSSKLNADNLELQIEQEITDLVRSIRSAVKRADLTFSARLVAEKALEISTSRFESGTITSTELAQAQTRLLQARLSALQALIDYNLALADLTRRTAWDFVRDREVTVPYAEQ